MPYIKAAQRHDLDPHIEKLAEAIRSCGDDQAGAANYAITRLIHLLIGDIRYQKIALWTGVLENVKQEFYRRVASPYEDQKIQENGDVLPS